MDWQVLGMEQVLVHCMMDLLELELDKYWNHLCSKDRCYFLHHCWNQLRYQMCHLLAYYWQEQHRHLHYPQEQQ